MRQITIIVLALYLAGCQDERSTQVDSANFEFIELVEGVYSCIHKIGGKAICNVGVVDNGEETIIFDSFLSPGVALELKKVLKKSGFSPVRYVINSHFHNDHIRGNQAFSKEARIISTQRTKEMIETEEPLQIAYEKENAPARLAYYDSLHINFKGDKNSEEYRQILMWKPYYETLSESHEKVVTIVPDMLVDSIQFLNGPDRTVQLIARGQGHTESDLVLYLPEDKILFTGDLVFNGCHPYIADGDIINWKAWLDYLKSLKVKTVIPGHGPLGDKSILGQMKNYLQDLEIAAGKLVDDRVTEQSFTEAIVPKAYKDWWFDQFYPSNLRFALESLKANNN